MSFGLGAEGGRGGGNLPSLLPLPNSNPPKKENKWKKRKTVPRGGGERGGKEEGRGAKSKPQTQN